MNTTTSPDPTKALYPSRCESCSEDVMTSDPDPDAASWCDDPECQAEKAKSADRHARWGANVAAYHAGTLTHEALEIAQNAIRAEYLPQPVRPFIQCRPDDD